MDDFIAHSLQKGHAAATINRRLTTLNTFYYFLEMIEDLPLPSPVQPRHFLAKASLLPRDAPESDIARLIAPLNHPREKAMLLIMLDCGLRSALEGLAKPQVIERGYLPNFLFRETDLVVTIGIDGLVVPEQNIRINPCLRCHYLRRPVNTGIANAGRRRHLQSWHRKRLSSLQRRVNRHH